MLIVVLRTHLANLHVVQLVWLHHTRPRTILVSRHPTFSMSASVLVADGRRSKLVRAMRIKIE